MEISSETDSDLGLSEPWIMLEDSDIEVCDDPSKTKEVEVSKDEELKQTETTPDVEEDDFEKLRNHRKFIEQLETTEDLSWDPTDIASDTTKVVEEPTDSKALCTRCSLCSVLLTKGGSKLASFLCNTFLALCVLALASGLAYYFQFDQLKTSNIKNMLVKYTQPEYAMRYDKYIEPKYEKNKHQMNYNDINKYQKYEDTTRKHERKVRKAKKYHENHEKYVQNDFTKRKDGKEFKDKKKYKNEFDEKRYNKNKFENKPYKQEYKDSKLKNSKSKADYKRK